MNYCGIYCIKNMINNKVYIGQSINIPRRWIYHVKSLAANNHVNECLQRSYNKYGKNNFCYYIIEFCEKEVLDDRELYWINFYGGINSSDNYNCGPVNGKGGCSHEIRLKISRGNKGKKRTGAALENIRAGIRKAVKEGKHSHNQSEETKQKISLKLTGRKLSTESRIKMSLSKKGKKLPKQSQETIQKRINKTRGKKRSAEFCQKASIKAKKQFAEGKISPKFNGSSTKGKKISQETRDRLSDSISKYWEKVHNGEIIRISKKDRKDG